MSSDKIDYTTKQKWISHTPIELKAKWHEYLDALSTVSKIKNDIDLYIYFLHSQENYSKNQIAELLDSHYTHKKLSRERIGQIIAKVRSSIQSGGEKS